MDVGHRMRELRKLHNITVNGMAELMGVSTPTITRWENGTVDLSASIIKKFCSIIGITLSDFFTIDDHGPTQLPPEIWKLVSDKNNYGLLKEIQARKNKGISNELIIEWLKSLDKTLEMVKQKGVYWVESETGETDTYSDKEKKEIIKGLEEKLKDPNFKRPWKKET